MKPTLLTFAATAGLMLAMVGCKAAPPRTAITDVGVPTVPVDMDLAPIAAEFDARADRPRVVALLSSACSSCDPGMAAIRTSVLDRYQGEDLHVFLVLPKLERCEVCAELARPLAGEDRVTIIHDRSGQVARAFARGILPVAQARDTFLFYPTGVRWSDGSGEPPRVDDWWHGLGRVAPQRHCTRAELPETLGRSVERLLLGR